MINQEFCNLFLRYAYINVTYLLYWFMFFFRLFNIFLKLARSSNDINVTTEKYLELLQNHMESLINPTTKKNNSSLMLDWLLILLSQILEQPGILNDLPTFVWQCFVWIFFPTTIKFSEVGGLTGSQFLEGDCWEIGGEFFQVVAVFTEKWELWQFADFRGRFGEKEGWCFWVGVDTPMHTMREGEKMCLSEKLICETPRSAAYRRVLLLFQWYGTNF